MREVHFSVTIGFARGSIHGGSRFGFIGAESGDCARRAIALVAPRTPRARGRCRRPRRLPPPPPRASPLARRVHLRHARPARAYPLAPRSALDRSPPARRSPSPRRARGSLCCCHRLRRVRRADGREGRQGGASLRRDSRRRRAVRLVPRGSASPRVHRGRRHDDLPGSTTASDIGGAERWFEQALHSPPAYGEVNEANVMKVPKASAPTPSARSTLHVERALQLPPPHVRGDGYWRGQSWIATIRVADEDPQLRHRGHVHRPRRGEAPWTSSSASSTPRSPSEAREFMLNSAAAAACARRRKLPSPALRWRADGARQGHRRSRGASSRASCARAAPPTASAPEGTSIFGGSSRMSFQLKHEGEGDRGTLGHPPDRNQRPDSSSARLRASWVVERMARCLRDRAAGRRQEGRGKGSQSYVRGGHRRGLGRDASDRGGRHGRPRRAAAPRAGAPASAPALRDPAAAATLFRAAVGTLWAPDRRGFRSVQMFSSRNASTDAAAAPSSPETTASSLLARLLRTLMNHRRRRSDGVVDESFIGSGGRGAGAGTSSSRAASAAAAARAPPRAAAAEPWGWSNRARGGDDSAASAALAARLLASRRARTTRSSSARSAAVSSRRIRESDGVVESSLSMSFGT